MRIPLHLLPVVFPWVLACSGESAQRAAPPAARANPPPLDTIVASDSADAVAIVAKLRVIAPTGGEGFDTAFAPKIDPEAVLEAISDAGLTLDDVNEEDTTVYLSRQEAEVGLRGRRGRAFTSLTHLGYISSQPYPQYSKLTFRRSRDALEVSVADWYRLRFVKEGGHLRLRRVSYVMLEAE
jgi:hypothetical protein